MKKILILIGFFAFITTSCDPMEDTYSELKASGEIDQSSVISGDLTYELTSDDFADFDTSSEEDIYETFNAFTSIEDAEIKIAPLLADVLSLKAKGVNALVNVKYVETGNIDDEDLAKVINSTTHELQDEDYPSFETLSNALTPSENIIDVLESIDELKTTQEGDVVKIVYNQFVEEPNGITTAYTFADEDYDLVITELAGDADLADEIGNLSYGNFNRYTGVTGWDNDELLKAFNVVLKNNFPSAKLEQVFIVTVETYGPTSTETFYLKHNNSGDYEYASQVKVTDYTFVDEDYDTVIAELSSDTDLADEIGNLSYGNFNRYTGDSGWDNDELLKAFNAFLKVKYPSTAVTDRYSITVETYGPTTTETFLVELTATGDYAYAAPVSFEETTLPDTEVITELYLYNGADWELKSLDNIYILTSADYDLMGNPGPGQYDNFSDSVSPENYLPAFLSSKYPYAQIEDSMFVIYKYYFGGSAGTPNRGTQFVFDGNSWSAPKSTLKFTYNGDKWQPNNATDYEFISEDYDLVATGLADNDDLTDEVGNLSYGNFNRYSGATGWDDSEILLALDVVLKVRFPDTAAGGRYSVTVETYGPSSTETFLVELGEDGNYNYVTE
ncbi:hypothetical protein Q4595_01345 [Wenyingzhuangia sp. 1_MG-2023]|nr:hypothetical protein [Wenyingzhuangia sp. 1_MG-2023]